jgi:hypothetical protein
MKKFLFVLFASLFFTALFIIGWQVFLSFRAQKGALQVTAAPESKVYLNDEYLGKTPLCRCDAQSMLSAGEYTIRVVPVNGEFPEFQEKVTISSGVLTVVDRKFAKDSLSEGSVISLTPLTEKEKASLLVVSFPEKATVLLDNNVIGETPLSFPDPTESDHVLRVQKNGYKEKTIRIRTPLGYKLTVAAYLSATKDLSSLLPSPVASPSATISPSVSADKPIVTILDTPTGFLRVRRSIGGSEIGQVSPGQSFPFVDEQSGWYAITLSNGETGWISSQYAKKNN